MAMMRTRQFMGLPVVGGMVAALLLGLGCSKTKPNPNAKPVSTSTIITPETKGKVTAAGATFVEPIMKVWADEVNELSEGGLIVNYNGSGSGAGATAMTKRLAEFGCSDAPLSEEQRRTVREDVIETISSLFDGGPVEMSGEVVVASGEKRP